MLAANFYISELLDIYAPVLSEKQARILDGYYNNDLSLSEIAENEGITRQGVCDIIKRCENQLIDYENKLKLCDTILNLKKSANHVKQDVDKLDELLGIIDKL